jgi:hypothetical protein
MSTVPSVILGGGGPLPIKFLQTPMLLVQRCCCVPKLPHHVKLYTLISLKKQKFWYFISITADLLSLDILSCYVVCHDKQPSKCTNVPPGLDSFNKKSQIWEILTKSWKILNPLFLSERSEKLSRWCFGWASLSEV